jgi:F-type H+-transporting ATPase subunit epsilon
MVFEGDVDIVVAPGVDGEMGILPHHMPVLTTLNTGVLKVRRQGREEVFAISGGVLEVQPDLVTVLADAAEHTDEIDVARAEEARKHAEQTLKSAPASSEAYLAAERALRRSNLRLNVARLRRRSGAPPAHLE